MTTTTAFLAQVKAEPLWQIYHVDIDNGFKPGYRFRVYGPKADSVTRVVLTDFKCKETTYKPLADTLYIESTDDNVLTIHFLFDDGTEKNPKIKAFFLRFFFFRDDPTLFRYKIKSVSPELVDDYKRDSKFHCCSPIDYLYSLDTPPVASKKAKSAKRETAVALRSMSSFDEGNGSGGVGH